MSTDTTIEDLIASATDVPDEVEPRLPETTEVGLAQSFVEQHHHDLCFVASSKKWIVWNGKRWVEDRTGRVTNLARQHCCKAYAHLEEKTNEQRAARSVARLNTIAAVQRLAGVDCRIAAVSEQWDQAPWLLNTPDGTIDLRTGAMGPHDRTHHIMQMTAVGPGGDGDCPMFMRFLSEITRGDEEKQAYLQRLFGYTLTGSIQEHALFFFYGGGANGKSVLLGTISRILADYACTAPPDAFAVAHMDRHPTELARLCRRRLVMCNETERGRDWAESRIKALSGGDRITARFMHQDFFEFDPTFKLVIAGNNKPGLRVVDEAIRRRFQLTHFDVTIPAERRDPDLHNKLKEEWPGILRWMINGCEAWQQAGLRPPESVLRATAEYLEEEDSFRTWLRECCEFSGSDKASNLFESRRDWCGTAGEQSGTRKAFGRELSSRGFASKHTRVGTVYVGVRVRPKDHFSEG